MPKKKDDVREPISLRQWKRMRHGRGYESEKEKRNAKK